MEGYEGELISFVDINPDDPWLNLSSGKTAGEDELRKLKIPDHLKPGMRRFHFVFFPKTHRLVFESKNTKGETLGPSSAQRAFERLLNTEDLNLLFGPIDVIVEPEKNALDEIFKIEKLKSVTIFITRPNGDDTGDAEREIMRRLEKMNAQSTTEVYNARKGESLKLDEEAKSYAEIGSHNGYVQARGKNSANEPVFESTEQYPMKERGTVEGDQVHSESFWDKAKELVSHITRR
ncbi:hypothetical protein GCM10009038_31350 [Salinicola rhizosphaerae]|uniref:DUF4747 family protein n=1 Tax=Salinicola rhizosphaerae TaxID=1443141 RepID=A0ABQ3EGR0_9GAMM|nr:hypothetical protein GCM10009038_31350 [Salinicola rhizosphaerae]